MVKHDQRMISAIFNRIASWGICVNMTKTLVFLDQFSSNLFLIAQESFKKILSVCSLVDSLFFFIVINVCYVAGSNMWHKFHDVFHPNDNFSRGSKTQESSFQTPNLEKKIDNKFTQLSCLFFQSNLISVRHSYLRVLRLFLQTQEL